MLDVVILSHSWMDGNSRTQLGSVSRLLLAANSDSDLFSDSNRVMMLLNDNNLTSMVLDFM